MSGASRILVHSSAKVLDRVRDYALKLIYLKYDQLLDEGEVRRKNVTTGV
jgi:hypothetical protein